MQPSWQHVASCVKGVEWGFGHLRFENGGRVLVEVHRRPA